MTHPETIREKLNELRVTTPMASNSDYFWFTPDRGSPNYFRLTPNDEDISNDFYCDVWVTTEFESDKIGDYHLKIEVVLYHGYFEAQHETETIASEAFAFDDSDSVDEVLASIPDYKEQANAKVEEYSKWAENLLEDAIERHG